MPADSRQHTLDRVRRPRVQITYDVETNGAMRKIELPFVIGVLADLSGMPKDAPKPLKERKFVPIDTMGALTGTEGKATMFYLRTQNPPRYQEELKHAILSNPGMGTYTVVTADEYLSSISPDRLPGFNIGLEVVIGIAVVIGFLVIFQSMYTAVMERTREIGILKSMGASRAYIVGIVLRETSVLACVGIILGIAASFALSAALEARFPTLDFVINIPYVWKAVLIAFIGPILGALYPALKAASKDPIDALAYE